MAERWLNVEEIAHHLGVAPVTVYRWLEKDTMPAHRVGKLWKFKASEVDQWVKQGGATVKAKTDQPERNS
jgi:excisionase family DNA binding protein